MSAESRSYFLAYWALRTFKGLGKSKRIVCIHICDESESLIELVRLIVRELFECLDGHEVKFIINGPTKSLLSFNLIADHSYTV